MGYLTVADAAKKWGISERTVRNYCTAGYIAGAFINGKVWNIPSDAKCPERGGKRSVASHGLLAVLRRERKGGIKGGIYHKVQIELTYNSNHIEGSKLSHDQTRYIYETNTVGIDGEVINVDDLVETVNHFRCIDMMIDQATQPLSEAFIKSLHLTLKNGTGDSRKDWFAVGEYKKLPNEVGNRETALPEDVPRRMKKLIVEYNSLKDKTFEDIIAFHYEFECIHPFQDGNGRVGRLILFKECLKYGFVPFIIDDSLKLYYYRGLSEWKSERGYLLDTCRAAQDRFKAYLEYYRIAFEK